MMLYAALPALWGRKVWYKYPNKQAKETGSSTLPYPLILLNSSAVVLLVKKMLTSLP